jgi:hypothetical protein
MPPPSNEKEHHYVALSSSSDDQAPRIANGCLPQLGTVGNGITHQRAQNCEKGVTKDIENF